MASYTTNDLFPEGGNYKAGDTCDSVDPNAVVPSWIYTGLQWVPNSVNGKVDPVTGGIGILVGSKPGAFHFVVLPGNGADSDDDKFAQAISMAGESGTIELVPGASYVTDRKIPLLPGQHLLGFGATIKRAAQVISSTTTGITSGSTTKITLPSGDGAKFKVGQQINVFNGANYGTQAVTISDITGDEITTATSFYLSAGSPWSGSTTVCSAYTTVRTASGATIEGVVFDGNKSNWTYARWETVSEVAAYFTNNVVKYCTIQNAPGEGIQDAGTGNYTGYGNIYAFNRIDSVNGNGIHLSGSYAPLIFGNNISNCNLNGASVGHNGGAVTLSNGIKNARIESNIMEACRAGVGQIDSTDNSHVLIANNVMKDLTAYFIEARGPNINLTDLTINANRFISSSPASAAENIAVDINDTGSGTIKRVSVTGNQFYNASLVTFRLEGANISGNTFETDYVASDTYHNALAINAGKNVLVAGNTFRNGNLAISIATSADNVVVSGNDIAGCYYYGIYAPGGASNSNLLISGNSVSSDTNVNNSYQGIVGGAKSIVRGNTVTLAAGHSGIRVNATAGNVVQANTVRGHAAGKTIRIEAGSTGYVVSENQVNYAVTDTAAVGVRVSNNDVIV